MKNSLIKRFISRFLGEEHLVKLSQSREIMSQEKFIEFLVKKGHDRTLVTDVLMEVYDLLPRINKISIYPDDDLITELKIDPEDIERVLENLFKKYKIPNPSIKDQEKFHLQNKDKFTVSRLVEFIEYFGYSK